MQRLSGQAELREDIPVARCVACGARESCRMFHTFPGLIHGQAAGPALPCGSTPILYCPSSPWSPSAPCSPCLPGPPSVQEAAGSALAQSSIIPCPLHVLTLSPSTAWVAPVSLFTLLSLPHLTTLPLIPDSWTARKSLGPTTPPGAKSRSTEAKVDTTIARETGELFPPCTSLASAQTAFCLL